MICYLFPEPIYFIFSPDPELSLVYYSHVLVTVLILAIGIFVYFNGRQFLLNKLLLAISASFALWSFADVITWTNVHSDVILFVWSFFGILFGLISILCVYFIHVFLNGGDDISFRLKTFLIAALAPLIVSAPTAYHLSGFNLTGCDAFGFEGYWYIAYYQLLGLAAMVWIFALLVRGYRRAASALRRQIVLMGSGIELFLFSFFFTAFLASFLVDKGILPDSEIEIYGMVGMAVFTALLGILLVRFKTFHASMIEAQALIVALVFLLGAEFTFVRSTINLLLVGLTILLTGAVGIVLIRSVKREIRQRELIEAQEKELEVANKQQETLLHFISHEVKGYLTESQAGFASIVEGDLGVVPEKVKTMSEAALKSVRRGVRTVMEILDASNMKKGTVNYKKDTFDLKAAVLEIVEHQQKYATERGLKIDVSIGPGTYTMAGDEEKIRQHVIRNLVDNAIKYTPKGTIEVRLMSGAPSTALEARKLRFSVKDSGVGITPEDKKNLFTEGGHGKDSIKINVHSTGYGLFIAKQIVDAHGGRICAESEGQGKGSTFIAEFAASA